MISCNSSQTNEIENNSNNNKKWSSINRAKLGKNPVNLPASTQHPVGARSNSVESKKKLGKNPVTVPRANRKSRREDREGLERKKNSVKLGKNRYNPVRTRCPVVGGRRTALKVKGKGKEDWKKRAQIHSFLSVWSRLFGFSPVTEPFWPFGKRNQPRLYRVFFLLLFWHFCSASSDCKSILRTISESPNHQPAPHWSVWSWKKEKKKSRLIIANHPRKRAKKGESWERQVELMKTRVK